MKSSEVRQLNEEELTQQLAALKKELFDLRMQKTLGKLTKPHHFRRIQRDFARILTIQRERMGAEKVTA